MATKLGIFNKVLRELKARNVTDTGEEREPARVIVDVYDDVVEECLATGSWNFATETIKVTADTGITPAFGHTEVFAKPTDWVKTLAVSQDEHFAYPELRYNDDVNYWTADYSPLYVRYVSNDTGMGLDLSRWPKLFERFVVLEIADRVAGRLTDDDRLQDNIMKKRDRARRAALNFDTMNEAQPKFAPTGSWNRSRSGGTSRGDRGSRSNLTG